MMTSFCECGVEVTDKPSNICKGCGELFCVWCYGDGGALCINCDPEEITNA